MGVLSEGAVLQVTDRPPKEPQGSNTVLLAGSTLSDLGVLDHGVVMINGHPFDARPHGAVPEGCVALDSMQCETMDAFIGETVEPQQKSYVSAPWISCVTLECSAIPPLLSEIADSLGPGAVRDHVVRELSGQHFWLDQRVLLVVADVRMRVQVLKVSVEGLSAGESGQSWEGAALLGPMSTVQARIVDHDSMIPLQQDPPQIPNLPDFAERWAVVSRAPDIYHELAREIDERTFSPPQPEMLVKEIFEIRNSISRSMMADKVVASLREENRALAAMVQEKDTMVTTLREEVASLQSRLDTEPGPRAAHSIDSRRDLRDSTMEVEIKSKLVGQLQRSLKVSNSRVDHLVTQAQHLEAALQDTRRELDRTYARLKDTAIEAETTTARETFLIDFLDSLGVERPVTPRSTALKPASPTPAKRQDYSVGADGAAQQNCGMDASTDQLVTDNAALKEIISNLQTAHHKQLVEKTMRERLGGSFADQRMASEVRLLKERLVNLTGQQRTADEIMRSETEHLHVLLEKFQGKAFSAEEHAERAREELRVTFRLLEEERDKRKLQDENLDALLAAKEKEHCQEIAMLEKQIEAKHLATAELLSEQRNIAQLQLQQTQTGLARNKSQDEEVQAPDEGVDIAESGGVSVADEGDELLQEQARREEIFRQKAEEAERRMQEKERSRRERNAKKGANTSALPPPGSTADEFLRLARTAARLLSYLPESDLEDLPPVILGLHVDRMTPNSTDALREAEELGHLVAQGLDMWNKVGEDDACAAVELISPLFSDTDRHNLHLLLQAVHGHAEGEGIDREDLAKVWDMGVATPVEDAEGSDAKRVWKRGDEQVQGNVSIHRRRHAIRSKGVFFVEQLDLSAGKKGSFTSTQTGKTGSSMPSLFTVEAIDQADSNRVSNTNIKIPQDALLVLHELYGQGLRVEDMLTSRKLVRFSLTRRQITRFCADPEQFSVEKVQLTRSAELGRTTDQRAERADPGGVAPEVRPMPGRSSLDSTRSTDSSDKKLHPLEALRQRGSGKNFFTGSGPPTPRSGGEGEREGFKQETVNMQETKQGTMKKRGYINRSWKDRYFIINGTNLEYYDSEASWHHLKEKKGSISLYGSIVSSDKPDAACKAQEFDLVIEDVRGKRKFHLRCSSASDRRSWIDAIQRVIDSDPARDEHEEDGFTRTGSGPGRAVTAAQAVVVNAAHDVVNAAHAVLGRFGVSGAAKNTPEAPSFQEACRERGIAEVAADQLQSLILQGKTTRQILNTPALARFRLTAKQVDAVKLHPSVLLDS